MFTRNFKLNFFIEVIPLVAIYVLIYGYLNLYCYYKMFHFSISPYISIDDIIPQSLETLLISAIFFLALWLINPFEAERDYESLTKAELREKRKHNFRVNYLRYITHICGFILTIFLLFCIVTYLKPLSNQYTGGLLYQLFFIYCLFPMAIVVSLVKNKSYLFFYKLHIGNSSLKIILTLLLVFILIAPFKAIISYYVTKNNIDQNFVTIVTSGKKITTTPEYHYIGQTANFIFYFDEKKTTTDAYAINDVKVVSNTYVFKEDVLSTFNYKTVYPVLIKSTVFYIVILYILVYYFINRYFNRKLYYKPYTTPPPPPMPPPHSTLNDDSYYEV